MQRHVFLDRQLAAVVVFRGDVEDAAVQARNLDAHVAKIRGHTDKLARKRAALRAVCARAERRRLCENQRHQRLRILRLAQNREQDSRTIFFHLHRRREHVQRACSQRFFQKVAADLRVHVVEVGLDHGDFFIEAGNRLFRSLANHDPNNIGLAFQVGGSSAIPDGRYTHRRLRAERIAKCRDNRRTGGRDEFFLHSV